MSIEYQPGQKPLVPATPPTWGEITPEGEKATVVRFVLADRVVIFPFSQLKRWEHIAAEPEILSITVGKEQIVIEGAELAAICAALDLKRLSEVRVNHERSKARPGPRVRRIAIETA